MCNRHRDRHTAKGSQLHRKDSILGHGSPIAESGKQLSMHGSSSPEVMRPNLAGIKSRTSQLQYQSSQDINSNPYTPATNTSSGNYSRATSSNDADTFPQANAFKRSNSDSISRGHDPSNSISGSRPLRHSSFGVSDTKSSEFARPPLQTAVGPYSLLSSTSGSQSYHGAQASPHSYVHHANFPPFSLPPPGFQTSATSAPSSRDVEPSFPTSMSTDYPSDTIQHQQSGPDLMLLDQMTAPNTMPVFGGEGYNRSPFAIPEDFVAYLFNGQQLDNSSPMGQMGQQGYSKLVANTETPCN